MTNYVINVNDVPAGEITGREIRDVFNQANTGSEDISLRITDVLPGQTTYPGHIHTESDEIILILSGEGDIKIGEAVFPIKPWDAIFIPRGKGHLIRNAGDDAMRMVCTFSTSDLARDLESVDTMDF
jgi:uncharacterized cupin superfamily protein